MAVNCFTLFVFLQITNLPEPYGTCVESNLVPVSQCLLDCKTEKVIQECGCHDVYMIPNREQFGECGYL